MSSTGDESSAVFSMHSRAVTRASTAASSMLTPLNGMGPARYPKPNAPGLRKLDTSDRVLNASYPLSQYTSTISKQSTQSRSPLEHGPEPFEEYGSPTYSASSGLNDLQRHRSTKQLISRYEELEVTAAPSRAPHGLPSNARLTEFSSPTLDKGIKMKRSSPIRHSIRNLLSVFHKGKFSSKVNIAGASMAENTNIIHLSDPPQTSFVSEGSTAKHLTTEKIECNTPTALHSGTLLYLSQGSLNPLASPILPVWTSCTATLHQKHILLTSHTSHGNPSTCIVHLSGCTDVGSLALNQISADERALLPNTDDPDGLRVFEIQFKTERTERFAASSAQQRSRWVSAIWDVIHQSQPQQERSHNEPASLETSQPVAELASFPRSTHAECSVYESPETPSTLRTNTSSSVYSEGCSPSTLTPKPYYPTPGPLCSTGIAASSQDCPLVSPGLTSRVASPLHLSPTGAPPRSKSPSIANLDHLSVVKQRLAEIKVNSAQEYPPGTRSPTPIISRNLSRTSDLSPRSPMYKSTGSKIRGNRELDKLRSIQVDVHKRDAISKPPSSDHSPQQKFPTNTASNMSQQDRSVPTTPTDFNRKNSISQGHEQVDDELTSIQDQLDDARQQLNTNSSNALMSVTQTVEVMQQQLNSELPQIINMLRDVRSLRDALQEAKDEGTLCPPAVLKNLAHSTLSSQTPGSIEVSDHTQISNVEAKLDALLTLQNTAAADRQHELVSLAEAKQGAPLGSDSSKLDDLLGLYNSEKLRQEAYGEQQADFGRYLNEMNTWLECFVNGGTSQIQAVASSVQRLRQELGCCSDVQGNALEAQSDLGCESGLLVDFRRLLTQNEHRDLQAATLQASVNSLLNIVRENTRQNTDGRDDITVASFIELIERRSKEQDDKLQALSNTLTDEIRGEKLRFFDAIKEATEINVQAHVERFKKELTREVFVAIGDLSRLQKEKQTVEQQIADLFAFLSKQKNDKPGSGFVTPQSRQCLPRPLRDRQQNLNMTPSNMRRRESSQRERPCDDLRRPLPNLLNPWNQ